MLARADIRPVTVIEWQSHERARYAGQAAAVLARADIRPVTVIEWQRHERLIGAGAEVPALYCFKIP